MAHPYKDKACGGAATAKARYADGGGVKRPSNPSAPMTRAETARISQQTVKMPPITPISPTKNRGGPVAKKADGGGVPEENVAVKIARGVNTISRAKGIPPNKGAISVQQNADMVAADKISDSVPRRGLNMEPARKSGGKVK